MSVLPNQPREFNFVLAGDHVEARGLDSNLGQATLRLSSLTILLCLGKDGSAELLVEFLQNVRTAVCLEACCFAPPGGMRWKCWCFAAPADPKWKLRG